MIIRCSSSYYPDDDIDCTRSYYDIDCKGNQIVESELRKQVDISGGYLRDRSVSNMDVANAHPKVAFSEVNRLCVLSAAQTTIIFPDDPTAVQ